MAPSILLTLPTEMIIEIYRQVPDPDTLINLALTNHKMHLIAKENFLQRHRAAAPELRDLDLRPGALGVNGAVLENKGTTGSLLAGYLEWFLLNRREGWYVKRLTIGGLRAEWDEEEEEEEGTTTGAAATTTTAAGAAAATAATATTAATTTPQPPAITPATGPTPHTPYPDATMDFFLRAHNGHVGRLLYDKQITCEQMGAFFEAKLRRGEEDVVAALLLCVLPGLERVRCENGRGV